MRRVPVRFTVSAAVVCGALSMMSPAQAVGAPSADTAPQPVAASPTQSIFCTWSVNGDFVRLRATPAGSNILGQLNRGDQVSGLASDRSTAGGHTWRKVFSPRHRATGWVAQQFLTTVNCRRVPDPTMV